MPFKSKAQMRKFFQLYRQGKISKNTLDKWLEHTKDKKNLPERVKQSKVLEGVYYLEGSDRNIYFNQFQLACGLIKGLCKEAGIYKDSAILNLLKRFNEALEYAQKNTWEGNKYLEKVATAFNENISLFFWLKEVRARRELEKRAFSILDSATSLGSSATNLLLFLSILGSLALPYYAGSFLGDRLGRFYRDSQKERLEWMAMKRTAEILKAKRKQLKENSKFEKALKEDEDSQYIVI